MAAQIGGQAVAQKQEVEQPPFGDGSHTLLHLHVKKALHGPPTPPTGNVIPSSEQKDTKVDRPWHDCTFKRQGLPRGKDFQEARTSKRQDFDLAVSIHWL